MKPELQLDAFLQIHTIHVKAVKSKSRAGSEPGTNLHADGPVGPLPLELADLAIVAPDAKLEPGQDEK